jgi:oligopeptidase B
VDEYYWLRNREDPEVINYLEEENHYLEAAMAHTRPLQERLFAELKGRLPESDCSVPECRGEYEYFTRMEPGKQYPVYLRRRRAPEAAEEVLLDQNALAEGHGHCASAAFEVSPDGAWLAYMVDYSGSEEYTLYIKNLETGRLLPESIPNTICYPPEGKVAWAKDSRTLLYATSDPVKRPDKVYRHRLGTDPAGDALVYHEPDEAFYAYVDKTRSGDYIVISLRSQDGTELRMIPAGQPESEPQVLSPAGRAWCTLPTTWAINF